MTTLFKQNQLPAESEAELHPKQNSPKFIYLKIDITAIPITIASNTTKERSIF